VVAVAEVVVDVLLDVDIRTTRWLWPHLAGFYLAQWAVIGAAFRASTSGGAAVLISLPARWPWSRRWASGHTARRPLPETTWPR
jgi:hypothetical protein